MSDDNRSWCAPIAQVFKALGHEARLELCCILQRAPHDVTTLSETLALALSTVSYHLRLLAKLGIVTSTVVEHRHIYQLSNDVTVRVVDRRVRLTLGNTVGASVVLLYPASDAGDRTMASANVRSS